MPKRRGQCRMSLLRNSRTPRIGSYPNAHTIGLDEIRQLVARLFGWQRTGRDIAIAVEDAVDRLLEQGYLVEEAGQYRLPSE